MKENKERKRKKENEERNRRKGDKTIKLYKNTE